MIPTLTLTLRFAGAGLLILAVVHVFIARHLNWREESARLAPVNGAIFRVHAFFICLILALMGLPCLIEPRIFLEPTRAGLWMSWSFAGFWAVRLYCQWFVYEAALWRSKRFETFMHWWLSLVWLALTTVFALCGLYQAGWIQ